MKHHDELTLLAQKYGTDKGQPNYYTPHYHRLLSGFRQRPLRLLEIGVGGVTSLSGHNDPDAGGQSLRMWKEYFPNAQIVSIDIHDKSALQETRIKIYQGSQEDADFLKKVNAESGPFDIIIDDGSHISRHIITSFTVLFPLMASDGIYLVEDLACSYDRKWGGDSFNLNNKKTSMGYFKSLLDLLNHPWIKNPYWSANPELIKIIGAVYFFPELIAIQKGVYDRHADKWAQRIRKRPFYKNLFSYLKHRWLQRSYENRSPEERA